MQGKRIIDVNNICEARSAYRIILGRQRRDLGRASVRLVRVPDDDSVDQHDAERGGAGREVRDAFVRLLGLVRKWTKRWGSVGSDIGRTRRTRGEIDATAMPVVGKSRGCR